jgi:Matrixin
MRVLDRYAPCCVTFGLVVTRLAVQAARSEAKDTGRQPWGSAGTSRRRVRWLVATVTLLTAVVSLSAQGFSPLDTSAPVPYFIEEGAAGSEYRSGDRQLALWALQAWERIVGGSLHFQPSTRESDALIQIHWVPAAEGQYGEARPLRVGTRRGAAVYIRPDTSALGPDIARATRSDPLMRETVVYLTCVHELGHALGLSHTSDFRDIMFFFGFGGDIPEFFGRYRRQLTTRDDIAKYSGVSETDTARIRALYH